MLRSVGVKALWDRRRSLLAWAFAVVALVGMYAGFFPSMQGSSAYGDLIDQMPASLRDLFTAGTSGDFDSGAGYLYLELLSFMAPLLVLTQAIGVGAGGIAGEEDRHTLDLVLAMPVSRRRLVLEQFGATAAGVCVLASAMAVAILGFGAAAGMGLSTPNVLAAMVHLTLLGLVFGAGALAVGAASGRLGPARTLPALVAVIAYLVNGFAPSVGWLRPVRPFSPFYQYLGHDPIRHGLSVPSLAVSVSTVVVLLTLAVALFARRDTH